MKDRLPLVLLMSSAVAIVVIVLYCSGWKFYLSYPPRDAAIGLEIGSGDGREVYGLVVPTDGGIIHYSFPGVPGNM